MVAVRFAHCLGDYLDDWMMRKVSDKERLEEVVENVVFKECGLTGVPMSVELPEDDYWYLYEQAERVYELEQQNKRYREAIEYIQREIRKAIYTPKKQKWNSDFEREFESGKTRGLIQASDIVKEAIEILEGEED